VGAVSGCGVLRLPSSQSLFDVNPFRRELGRVVVRRQVDQPTLVLGSTQATELVVGRFLRERGVALARRRGGGGAVFLRPGDHVWVDAWIPRDDPLWDHDVSRAAEWVGAWWRAALEELGAVGFEVHTGRAEPGDLGALVCFAGRGPGEVLHAGRKVVGLSQWRSREGALFSSCAYDRWDPAGLMELLDGGGDGRGDGDGEMRASVQSELRTVAKGVGELEPPVGDLEALARALFASFDGWTDRGATGRS
jgi:lipoate---protein ligase